jgi:hypothetical protein
MLKKLLRFAGIAAFAAGSSAVVSPAAFAQAEQQQLVTAAETAMTNFLRDPEMKWLQQTSIAPEAVLITGRSLAFIIGGCGRGVLVAKDAKSGKWVGPAFYTLATASVGFQAGISVSEMVTLVMTDKGLNSLMASTFKMGADASIAAGPVGAGAKSDIVADLIAFTFQGRLRRGEPRRHRRLEQHRMGQCVLRQEGAATRHPRAHERIEQGCGQAAGNRRRREVTPQVGSNAARSRAPRGALVLFG